MEAGSRFIRDPPGKVRELYTTSALVTSSVTLLSAVKVFSQVGKVLGWKGRVAWLKAARKRKWRLWGSVRASAAWKDRESTPRRPTDSPQRQAPFFPEDSDALQFWAFHRARMSPKWRSIRRSHLFISRPGRAATLDIPLALVLVVVSADAVGASAQTVVASASLHQVRTRRRT